MAEVHERIAGLMFKFHQGDLSSTEERELNDWRFSSEETRQLFDKLTDEKNFYFDIKEMHHFKNDAWKKIELETGVGRVVYMRQRWIRWIAAASIVLMLGFGAYLVFFNKSTVGDSQFNVAQTHDVSAPTETKATITLSDGRMLYVDSTSKGIIAQQSNVSVIKNENGQIVYRSTTKRSLSTVQYNTLTNPRGSKVIDMQLSDGSHVWLNAGSSVKYPVAFVGNNRLVEITGEVYFEVTHNTSKPFIVTVNDIQVEVLGTHFNINSYNDEEAIRTTLLEGKVRVIRNGSIAILKPGEQIGSAEEGGLSKPVRPDLEKIMAWKNNEFNFTDDDIQSIMRQLARWYNIRPVITGTSSINYTGRITRDVALRKVLEMFEKIGYVKFEINGDEVKVITK